MVVVVVVMVLLIGRTMVMMIMMNKPNLMQKIRMIVAYKRRMLNIAKKHSRQCS